MSPDFIFSKCFDGSEDGETGVVDEDVNLSARILKVFDSLPAVGVVDVELDPFPAFAFDLGDEVGALGGDAGGGD